MSDRVIDLYTYMAIEIHGNGGLILVPNINDSVFIYRHTDIKQNTIYVL